MDWRAMLGHVCARVAVVKTARPVRADRMDIGDIVKDVVEVECRFAIAKRIVWSGLVLGACEMCSQKIRQW
jgi:hypothetical protein